MKKLLCAVFLFFYCLFQFQISAQVYHEDDKEGLRQFLRQPAAVVGKFNYETLGLAKSDTLGWYVSEDWITKIPNYRIIWNQSLPKRITEISVDFAYTYYDPSLPKFAGEFDCSYFQQLTKLVIGGHVLSKLDVSNNIELLELHCPRSKSLISLDIAKNVKLKKLNCSDNNFSNINIENNVKLEELDLSLNNISNIDITSLYFLKKLVVNDNRIHNLDLRNNGKLEILWATSNGLESLDVSLNPALRELHCYGNKLNRLIVDSSTNPNLEILSCYSNKLTSLNIVGYKYLQTLEFTSNPLESLIIKNNNSLEGIFIDELNNSLKPISIYIENNLGLRRFRMTGATTIVEVKFKDNVNLYDCSFWETNLEKVDIVNSPNLAILSCSNNKFLSSLDLKSFPNLYDLRCSYTGLNDLDVSSNLNLYHLNFSNTAIANIDLNNHKNLAYIDCSNTKLSKLDLSNSIIENARIICNNSGIEQIIWGYASVHSFIAYNNKLRFSTLPTWKMVTAYDRKYLYSPQNIIYGEDSLIDNIDISSEYNIRGTITQYSWYTNQDFPVSLTDKGNGIFAAPSNYVGDTLVCKMTNAEYPSLTLTYKVKITDAAPSVFLQNHLMVKTSEAIIYSTTTNERFQVYANISDPINVSIGLFDQGGRFIEDVAVSKKNSTYTCKISDSVLPGNYMVQPYLNIDGKQQVVERPANSYFIDKLPISVIDDIWGRSVRSGYLASDATLSRHMQIKTSESYYHQVAPGERFQVYANYAPSTSDIKIGLFNLYGAFVEEVSVSKKSSTYTCQISDNVPSGNYVIMPYEIVGGVVTIVERTKDSPIMDRLPLAVEEDIWSFGLKSLVVKDELEGVNNNIKLYPNPTSDILYIDGIQENEVIDIYDLSGRLVKSTNSQAGINGISIVDLPQGTYIVKIGGERYKIQKM